MAGDFHPADHGEWGEHGESIGDADYYSDDERQRKVEGLARDCVARAARWLDAGRAAGGSGTGIVVDSDATRVAGTPASVLAAGSAADAGAGRYVRRGFWIATPADFQAVRARSGTDEQSIRGSDQRYFGDRDLYDGGAYAAFGSVATSETRMGCSCRA